MNSLPELAGGRIHYRLPLTDAAAIRLANVLLAGSAYERAEQLAEALACDGALAVWAVLVAPEPADAATPLPSLVGWLSPRIARLLACPVVTADRTAGNAARQNEFERWHAAGSSNTAARVNVEPHTAGTAEQNRRFVGLAAGAVEWLTRCGTPTPDRHEALQALPAWLTQMLAYASEPAPTLDANPADRDPGSQQICSGGGHDWAERLARLAAQTVRLADLETNFDNAVEQEKLAALKEFAYGAGHEINNPLANISARAQTLLKDERDPERRQKLAAINTQAFRAHEMIADLMLFAQPPEWKSQRVAIGPLVAELASAWRRQAADQQTTFDVRIADESLAAWADRGALAVALRALVANAFEALGRGGTIELAVTPAQLANEAATDDSVANDAATIRPATSGSGPNAVAICVRDDGPGIDATVRPRIFDPFFSGREAGRGLGFGLPKCWRIATALGGRIDMASGPVAGAAFTLVLPMAPAGD